MMDRRQASGVGKDMTRPKPKTIGYETIYPQQSEIAGDVLKNFAANRSKKTAHPRTAVVFLQMQSGKTGVIMKVINDFIDDCKRRGRTFQVVVLCGLPHLDLTEQTRSRLTRAMAADGKTRIGARLDAKAKDSELDAYPQEFANEGILIWNNSTRLANVDLTACEVDERLVIVDEVHLGNVKNGCIDTFLRNHGIKISEQMHAWDSGKTINHVVGVSATPFAHFLQSEEAHLHGEALFKSIYRDPPSTYTGPETMRANGRLQQTEQLFQDNGKPSAFFKAVMDRFHKDCRSHGNGYLVLRARGKAHEQLIQCINKVGKIECREVDAEQENIDELNDILGQKPQTPTFVVIRGSMRAGITLDPKHHIRGWVETKSIAVDAQVQAGVGRACGYGRKDTYPIYCDLDAVDAYIKFVESVRNASATAAHVPAGVQSKAWREGSTRGARYRVKKLLPFNEAFAIVQTIRDQDRARNKAQISKTSGNFINDVADMCMKGTRDNSSTIGYLFDAPMTVAEAEKQWKSWKKTSQEKYPTPESRARRVAELTQSFNKAIALHPEWKGKVAMLDLDHPLTAHRNTLQKKRSALLSNQSNRSTRRPKAA